MGWFRAGPHVDFTTYKAYRDAGFEMKAAKIPAVSARSNASP